MIAALISPLIAERLVHLAAEAAGGHIDTIDHCISTLDFDEVDRPHRTLGQECQCLLRVVRRR
jgi:hypothetical protein